MTLYVALLRGINVGRGNRVAMADLRAAFEGMGFQGVRTLLNSGNVVFRADQPDAGPERIEAGIAAQLGLNCRIFLVAADELSAILAENPFPQAEADPSRLLLAFVRDAADLARLAPLADRDWQPERLGITARAAYLWCPDGISAGQLAEAAFKALGDKATTRNLSTVVKLRDCLAG